MSDVSRVDAERAEQVFCIAKDANRDTIVGALEHAGLSVLFSSSIDLDQHPRAQEVPASVVDAAAFATSEQLATTLARLARYSSMGRALGVVRDPEEEARVLAALAALHTSAPVDVCRLSELKVQVTARLDLLATRAERAYSRDSLTGLGNRTAMREYVATTLQHFPEHGLVAAFILDVDHFKSVNDRYGHAAGDGVLRHLGEIVKTFGTSGVRGFRIGGDEVGGIVTANAKHEVAETLEDLRSVVAGSAVRRDGDSIRVTVSIGFTFLNREMELDDVFQEADIALYAAKSGGRNRVHCFDLSWDAASADPNLAAMAHFENVARVWTQRLSDLVVSAGRHALEESRRTAERDGLTELYNRRYFDRKLSREIENAVHSHGHLSLLLIDVDDFHDVNMTYGYPTGDRVLKAVAELITNHSRTTDWVARYGGEEFCVVMPATGSLEAQMVAERIREAVAAAQIDGYEDRVVNVTVSAGVASLTEVAAERADGDALIQVASDHVIAAKRSGKNQVVAAAPIG